ncbi:ABCF1 [Cordylochernes scorpioides]|uniref:ABCF1 n=1 Tax=Cordylochernes scorpioides TaxID=51811 RepID=A0ABY6KXE4_9ARAC|nr:ABCF1 [Cordylochernes scorpioides]
MGKNQLSRRDKKAQKRKEKFAKTCDEVSRKFREPNQSDCGVQHVISRPDIHDGATLLHLTDIKMTAGRRVLLENAEIRLRKGRKYGLVGRNGLGKTTLLRNMVNGTFQIPSTIDMYLCEQDPVISKDVTVFQYLLDSNAKVTALQKEAERLEDEPDSIERLNTIYEELDAYRADASEARARKILKGLGFLEKMQNGKASSLSGGWVQRLSLARALYIQPDLLLLDEPTNHLDIDAVLWLQVYLHSWKKTLIVVSHYQDFLNQVCTDIIHLDNRTLTPYKGAYNVFQLPPENVIFSDDDSDRREQQWDDTNFEAGYKNIANLPLIDSENIYLPPLHIKLGLMKNFVKAMDRNASGFAYLKQKFSSISEAKIKEGIFVGPQIRELQQDGNFQNSLNEVEAAAWNSFRNVCKNFLGSVKVENYRDIVNDLLLSYKALVCNMSLKIHFLHSHLDFFPDNLGAVSDEHGERFHQDISSMEKRYQELAKYPFLINQEKLTTDAFRAVGPHQRGASCTSTTKKLVIKAFFGR